MSLQEIKHLILLLNQKNIISKPIWNSWRHPCWISFPSWFTDWRHDSTGILLPKSYTLVLAKLGTIWNCFLLRSCVALTGHPKWGVSGWGQGFKINGPLRVFQSHQGQQPGVQERSLSLWRSPLLCSAEGHASNRPTQSPDLWEKVSESKKGSTGSWERWAEEREGGWTKVGKEVNTIWDFAAVTKFVNNSTW